MKVCEHCGSPNVYFDAWSGVNDPSDVLVFDYTFCMDCDDQCTVVDSKERESYVPPIQGSR